MKMTCEKASSVRVQGALGQLCGLRLHHHGACGLRICPRGEENEPLVAVEMGSSGSVPLWKAGLLLGGGIVLLCCARRGICAVRSFVHDGCVRRQVRAETRRKAKMREAQQNAR